MFTLSPCLNDRLRFSGPVLYQTTLNTLESTKSMPQSMKTLLIVTALIVWWAGASAVYGLTLQWVQPCMSFGVVICALLLLLVSRNENSWKRMTGQPYDEEQSAGFLLIFLIGLPVTILLGAFVTWLGTLILMWLGFPALSIPI